MPTKKPCIECAVRPKWGGRHRCIICYYRHQPIGDRITEAKRRLALVPEPLRLARVSKDKWPDGERWCAGCQSFIPLEDCRGSRCVPCASGSQHGSMIEKVYGLTAEGYENLLKLQGGKCAICRNRPKSKRLAVDHDHQTGAVRGLLCSTCNHDLLGAGYDSPAKLLAAWHYLNTPPTTGVWREPEKGLLAPAVDAPAYVETEAEDDLSDPGGAKKTAEPVGRVVLPTVAEARVLSFAEMEALREFLKIDYASAPF